MMNKSKSTSENPKIAMQGHVLRMEPDSLPRTAITWASERNQREREREID